MKIIDNFLTKSYYQYILELLTSPNFGWNYISDITGGSQSLQFNNYGFAHKFIHEERGPISEYAEFMRPLLYQILDITDCDYILRARADMVTWSGKEDFIHPAHNDYSFPNTAAVFYINETDGDTIFYNAKRTDVADYKNLKEYDRVSPKANRLVIFDGDLLHTGCSPIKHKNRIIINSNYIKENEYQRMDREKTKRNKIR